MIEEIIYSRKNLDVVALRKKLKALQMQVARESQKTVSNSLEYLKFQYRSNKKEKDENSEFQS